MKEKGGATGTLSGWRGVLEPCSLKPLTIWGARVSARGGSLKRGGGLGKKGESHGKRLELHRGSFGR